MIDDDDVTFVALLFADGRGWIGAVLFVLAVAMTSYVACENSKECEQRSCPSGKRAELLEGRCVCVEAAK
jgi:hypothetical protein